MSVDGNRAVDGGRVDKRRATAELHTLFVIIPRLAPFGADRRMATERAVAIRFDDNAGLVAVWNANRKRTVFSVRLQA